MALLDAPSTISGGAQAPDGEIYVAGLAMAIPSSHRFSADGTLLATWGGISRAGLLHDAAAIWVVDRLRQGAVGRSREQPRLMCSPRGRFPSSPDGANFFSQASDADLWMTATWCSCRTRIPRSVC